MTQSDIEILFAHLLHSKSLVQESLFISGQQVILLKFRQPSSSAQPVISDKEKATFVLEQNASILDEHISKTRSKISKL